MLKKKKGLLVIVMLSIFGVLLIVIGNIDKTTNTTDSKIDYEKYVDSVENKIKNFLLKIEGIEKAEVIVTLDNSTEQIYAQNQESSDFVIIDSDKGQSPVYITEVYPTVRGIAIACSGGEQDAVKMKITKLIAAYLNISTNRIEIVGIK